MYSNVSNILNYKYQVDITNLLCKIQIEVAFKSIMLHFHHHRSSMFCPMDEFDNLVPITINKANFNLAKSIVTDMTDKEVGNRIKTIMNNCGVYSTTLHRLSTDRARLFLAIHISQYSGM
ncbi:MAG: hypothetical protein ACRCXZ_08500 [Patescibacteria group bacterium]